MEASAVAERPRGIYPRGSEEFSRVLAFSDGLFAIAMTLLVVGIDLPNLHDPDVSTLADAIGELNTSITCFVISFAVIGFYWLAHHRFFFQLARIDRGLIAINLVYLGLIAFMPFPTDMLGTYFDNPLAIAVYALTVCAVSGMEVVLLAHAQRRSLLHSTLPPDVYRWALMQSGVPLLPFLASVPVAFLSASIAPLLWLGAIPIGAIMRRRQPAGADELFGG